MIVSIRPVDGLVLEDGGRVRSPLAPIFGRGQGGGEHRPTVADPAAFTSDRAATQLLELELDASGVVEYRLEGYLAQGDIRLFTGEARCQNHGPLVVCVALELVPTEVAALRHRPIRWRLTRTDTGEQIAEQTVTMELYFVRRAPDTRFRKGLSLDVLRRVAEVLEEKGRFEVSKVGFGYVGDVVPEVVRWCFFRNPPSYDIWNGAPHYCDPADMDNIILFLGAYIRTYSDPFALCNCYDMASLVQYFLETLGYGPIAWAFMEPFGYLRLTLLVGRGSNNSPIFGRSGGPPVVPCHDPERTAFGNHSFCYLGWKGTIADACSGPHLGDEGVAEYVAAATDGCFPDPPSIPRGTVADITYSRGVTRVLPTRPAVQTLARHNIGFFEQAIDWKSPPPVEGETMAPLAVDWPDPRRCPELEGWSLALDDLAPGYPEVRRQWRFRRGDQGVTLTVHVASDGPTTAQRRFLAAGSMHSAPSPIWERGPDKLGEVAARSPYGGRLLWLFRTVVVLLESRAPDVDLVAVARWLQDIIEQGDPDGRPPRVEGINVAATVERGTLLEARVACEVETRVEYAGGHPGLQLIAEDGAWLTFRTVRDAAAELRVVVVDPTTLLSTLAAHEVDVVG